MRKSRTDERIVKYLQVHPNIRLDHLSIVNGGGFRRGRWVAHRSLLYINLTFFNVTKATIRHFENVV